jgi:hypothetical protein
VAVATDAAVATGVAVDTAGALVGAGDSVPSPPQAMAAMVESKISTINQKDFPIVSFSRWQLI